MRKKFYFALIILLNSTHSQAFNLVTAWQSALENAPEYASAQAVKRIDSEAENQALAELLPSINGNSRYQEQPQSNANDSSTYGWNVQLSQSIYNSSKWNQYQKGKVRSTISDLVLVSKSDELLKKVTQYYFELLIADEQLKLIVATKRSLQQQLNQAEAMYKKGAGSIIDYYDAQSGFDEIITEEVSARNQYVVAFNKLQHLTGRMSGELEAAKAFQPIDIHDSLSWTNMALNKNAGLLAKKASITEAEYEVKSIKGQHLPTLDVNAGYQNNINKREQGGTDLRYRDKGHYMTLGVNIPIFSGGGTSSKVRESVARRDQLEQEYFYAKDQVSLEIETLISALRINTQQVEAFSKLVSTNKMKLDATEIGLKAGIRTQTDLIKAQQDYLEAQKKLAEAKHSYISGYLTIVISSGDTENLEQKAMAFF